MNMDITKTRTFIDLIRNTNTKNSDDIDKISNYFEALYNEIDPLLMKGFKIKDIIASVLISDKNIICDSDSTSSSIPKLIKELVAENQIFSLFDFISFETPNKDTNSLDHVTCTIVDICDEYIVVDDVKINKKSNDRCIFRLEEIYNANHL